MSATEALHGAVVRAVDALQQRRDQPLGAVLTRQQVARAPARHQQRTLEWHLLDALAVRLAPDGTPLTSAGMFELRRV